MGNQATFYHYDLFRSVLNELELLDIGYTATALRSRKEWRVEVAKADIGALTAAIDTAYPSLKLYPVRRNPNVAS